MRKLFSVSDYTDSDVFEQEQKQILSNCWHFGGFIEELTNIGDYITVQAGLNNILVFRNDNGTLSAFHNICRHRGMRLLDGRGKLNNTIVCPYHDWTYSKTGGLQSLPKHKQEFAGLDKRCLSLKAANVGCWRGMIWVHPDSNVVSAEHYFADLTDRLAPYDIASLIEVKSERFERTIQANWKLVAENFIDHYHLAQLHAGTLNMYQHNRAEFGFFGEHFYFWEPLSKDYACALEQNAPYPLLLEANQKNLGVWAPMLFPCTGLVETESSWSVFQMVPLAVDQTKIIVRTKVKNCSTLAFVKQAARSFSYWQCQIKAKNERLGEQHPLASGDFMLEDIYVCEQLQKSLASPYMEFGPSASYGESPIREFHRLIKSKLS